jgi:hypothetical protein
MFITGVGLLKNRVGMRKVPMGNDVQLDAVRGWDKRKDGGRESRCAARPDWATERRHPWHALTTSSGRRGDCFDLAFRHQTCYLLPVLASHSHGLRAVIAVTSFCDG